MSNFIKSKPSPLNIAISFKSLIEYYESQLDSKDPNSAAIARYIVDKTKDYPILKEGFTDIETLEKHRHLIDIVFRDVFSAPLSDNEIKMATIPFLNYKFYSSRRFRKILANAGDDFELKIDKLSEEEYYKVACIVILNMVYGFDISYKRPFIYDIPDSNGVTRHYKILYNADFVQIEPLESAPKITEKDFEELLDSFDDIELWKKKFPLNSYIFKGFVLANMVDVTDDHSISTIKTTLITEGEKKDKEFMSDFKEVFRSLFGLKDLEVGFLSYKKEAGIFERVFGDGISSFLIRDEWEMKCSETLCGKSFDTIINQKQLYTISDIDKFYKLSKGKSPQYRSLKKQGFKSAILAPIASGDELLGVLELVSYTPKVLNSITANRLRSVMPFIVSSVERSKRDQKNLIEAIIQQECTSIHESVKWKFERAALKFIKDSYIDSENVQFEKIIINNVYPLYGQIDVQGSSAARNLATQKDLSLQLKILSKIFESIINLENLPIYEQILHQIESFQKELEENFKVDSEQIIYNFVTNEVHPILNFQSNKFKELDEEIADYLNKIDEDLNVIYYYRKNYDDSVAMINSNMSSLLDSKQKEAQSYYPHYFERYKTDGVEHNMYIGNEITREDDFNKVYLYNLRLWQLQVMCEMENDYYQNQHQYPLALDVASMILVFGTPLSIRFRMDEKKFDVDGTYNARYEVVKKRVDKANIKGTDERITQKGKMTIVYSRKEDEEEYLRYVKFLQSKHILDNDLEILELEDLQGVTGLSAIRISILYHKKDEKDFYTYNDLMKTLNA